MPRVPRLTEEVLNGLIEAYTRMEADDLTDLPDERVRAFDAAGRWLSRAAAAVAARPRPDPED
jgi:hypothetical protein